MNESIAAGLADTLKALRAELTESLQDAKPNSILFELGQTDVEFEVAITKDVGADGGIRFGVVSFGASGKLAKEATHRISLSLKPVMIGENGEPGPALVHSHTKQKPK